MTNPHIVILGNIASGKSTLMRNLGEDLSLQLLAEDTTANPYLAKLRVEPERWCFHNQLWFLSEAYESQVRGGTEGGVADHSAEEVVLHTPIFQGQGWLTSEEVSIFRRLHQYLFSPLRKPDLYIVLQTPPEVCVLRVASRGRTEDVSPSTEYLSAVQARRERFLAETDVPVVSINSGVVDFRREAERHIVNQAIVGALRDSAGL